MTNNIDKKYLKAKSNKLLCHIIILTMIMVCLQTQGCQQSKEAKEVNSTTQDFYIEHCENIIERLVIAPSTLKFIDRTHSMSDGKETVIIEYDSSNRMGVPIRDKAICIYGENALMKEYEAICKEAGLNPAEHHDKIDAAILQMEKMYINGRQVSNTKVGQAELDYMIKISKKKESKRKNMN